MNIKSRLLAMRLTVIAKRSQMKSVSWFFQSILNFTCSKILEGIVLFQENRDGQLTCVAFSCQPEWTIKHSVQLRWWRELRRLWYPRTRRPWYPRKCRVIVELSLQAAKVWSMQSWRQTSALLGNHKLETDGIQHLMGDPSKGWTEVPVLWEGKGSLSQSKGLAWHLKPCPDLDLYPSTSCGIPSTTWFCIPTLLEV